MDHSGHLPIQFHYPYKKFYFPNRTALKQYIIRLIRKEGKKPGHLNYIFCSDSFLLGLNQQYLRHDTYTDIITFPFSGAEEPILSDIYISIDRVRENAQVLNIPFHTELLRVIFHGALHLCGYKDKTKAEVALMRDKEDAYLKNFVSRGTQKV